MSRSRSVTYKFLMYLSSSHSKDQNHDGTGVTDGIEGQGNGTLTQGPDPGLPCGRVCAHSRGGVRGEADLGSPRKRGAGRGPLCRTGSAGYPHTLSSGKAGSGQEALARLRGLNANTAIFLRPTSWFRTRDNAVCVQGDRQAGPVTRQL